MLLAAPALFLDHQAHHGDAPEVVAAAVDQPNAEAPPTSGVEPGPSTTDPATTDALDNRVGDGRRRDRPDLHLVPAVHDACDHEGADDHRSLRPTTAAAPHRGRVPPICVRHRESRGNYQAVNPQSGTGGAYQFHQVTWNEMARTARRTDLVGVRPEQAAPASQDQMAHVLYTSQGRGPWGGYCAV